MDVWIEKDECGELVGVYKRGCDMPDVYSPRTASSWEEIHFEELKKGDHFRLIDDYHPRVAGNTTPLEDGKMVHIARSDATTRQALVSRAEPFGYGVDVLLHESYPGKGAGFDWYAVIYGDDWLRDKRRKLWDLQGFDRA